MVAIRDLGRFPVSGWPLLWTCSSWKTGNWGLAPQQLASQEPQARLHQSALDQSQRKSNGSFRQALCPLSVESLLMNLGVSVPSFHRSSIFICEFSQKLIKLLCCPVWTQDSPALPPSSCLAGRVGDKWGGIAHAQAVKVGLDQRGDRLASYGIQNSRRGADGKVAFTTIAEYSAALGSFSSFTSTPLWTTGDESLTVPSVFLDCPRGSARDSLTTRLCLPCPDGWFAQNSSMDGEQECIPCPAGWVSADVVASTACRACPAGSFRSTQDTVCTSCARGTFTASSGMSACEACPMGSFGEEDGLSECQLCGQDRHSQGHFATMYGIPVGSTMEYAYLIGATNATDCTCDRHFRMDSSGECVECTEGMICRGMNSVEIESGYFSEAQLSVFRCALHHWSNA